MAESNSNSNDYSGWLTGLGALAGAWGTYENDQQRNKLLKEQFNYEKQKDALAKGRMDMAQINLEDAFNNSDLAPKKKKNADGTPVIDSITPTATA